MRFKFIQLPPTSLDMLKKKPWKFYQQYQTTFAELCRLCEILLVLPVDTAQCEHGLSVMGIVKSNRRNRLSDNLRYMYPGEKVRANTRRKADTVEVRDLMRDYANNYCV